MDVRRQMDLCIASKYSNIEDHCNIRYDDCYVLSRAKGYKLVKFKFKIIYFALGGHELTYIKNIAARLDWQWVGTVFA